MYKRCLAVITVFMLMTSIVLSSCGDENEAAVTTKAADVTSIPETVDNNPYDLPTNLDYGETEFNLLVWEQDILEYDVEQENGETVNDAIFKRNRTVEDQLGVKLVYLAIPGNSSNVNNFVEAASNSVLSGVDEYQAIGCYIRCAGLLAMQGHILNLHEVDNLNFENPYWPDSLSEMNTINNKLFYASGDIATSILFRMAIMVYNVDLYDQLGIAENPQELAIEGKWTLDKLLTMAAGVYQDVNNDGKKSENDIYGLMTISHPWLDAWFQASDLRYVEVDATTGKLAMSPTFSSEKTIKLIEKLNGIFWGSNDGYYADKSSKDYLVNGTSLFFVAQGNSLAVDMRNASYKYAILPMPKYDENQKNYRTMTGFTHSLYCIPTSVKDSAKSGAVLEYLAAMSYDIVTPAVFENVFKGKRSNSDLDTKCLDILKSNIVFDIARIMHDNFPQDRPVNLFRKRIQNNDTIFASECARMIPLYEQTLSDIMKAFE